MISTVQHKQLIVRKGRDNGNLLFVKAFGEPENKFQCFASAAKGLKDCIGKYLPEVKQILNNRGYYIVPKSYARLRVPLADMIAKELEGQIEWFESLRDTILKGDKETALAAINAALKMLERGNNDRHQNER